MKGLTKTIVALALVIAVLATMGMSAMAEQVGTYSTKTTYKADGQISVTAKASNLEEGDIVTYVATTDASDVNEKTIVYINQAEVETGKTEATFEYTTPVTNIDASMFFGGSKEETRVEVDGVDTDSDILGYDLIVKFEGAEIDEVLVTVPEQETGVTSVIRKIELGSDVLAGLKVTSLAIGTEAITDGFAADADTIIVNTGLINATGLTMTVNCAKADDLPPVMGFETQLVDDTITAYAKAPAAKRFGVVMYTNSELDVEAVITKHEVIEDENKSYVVLPALGKNVDGIYSVELQDYTDWLTEGIVYVKAYAFDGTAATVSALAKELE